MSTGDTTARIFGERYVLGERLTASESREVWQAHDDIVSRQVALKIYFGPTAADPVWREQFRHDADRLATLSHPGIATLYEHAESDDETWLAMAFVDGQRLSDRLAVPPALPPAEAIELVGQAALAVSAAHDIGLGHGAMTPDNLLIRAGGSVALIGFAIGSAATRADDVRGLGELVNRCIDIDIDADSAGARPPEIDEFVRWLNGSGRSGPVGSAAEIGRTALALAASLRGGHTTAVTPQRRPAKTEVDEAPGYDEADRKRVRNRLLVLGTIVVVGGAALLRFVGEGGGDVFVPNVVGLQVNQAKLKLTYAGLVPKVTTTATGRDSGQTVVSESPRAGQEVKAGSSITLTISEAGG
jgi:tRNA A-37 threonylcarbamoyl transferase component Bud32